MPCPMPGIESKLHHNSFNNSSLCLQNRKVNISTEVIFSIQSRSRRSWRLWSRIPLEIIHNPDVIRTFQLKSCRSLEAVRLMLPNPIISVFSENLSVGENIERSDDERRIGC